MASARASVDPSTSLAALVTERPARSEVLERFGLDYCCGGERALDDACATAGLETAEVVAAIDESDAAEPAPGAADVHWPALGLGALAGHIVDAHHTSMRAELPRLTELLDKVLAAHGDRHPELHEVRHVFAGLRSELELHLLKEERVLFPWCLGLAGGDLPEQAPATVAGPVHCMEAEHDGAAAQLRVLRSLTGDYRPPPDACASYEMLYHGLSRLEADLHEHIHKENYVLFPLALAREAELRAAAVESAAAAAG